MSGNVAFIFQNRSDKLRMFCVKRQNSFLDIHIFHRTICKRDRKRGWLGILGGEFDCIEHPCLTFVWVKFVVEWLVSFFGYNYFALCVYCKFRYTYKETTSVIKLLFFFYYVILGYVYVVTDKINYITWVAIIIVYHGALILGHFYAALHYKVLSRCISTGYDD